MPICNIKCWKRLQSARVRFTSELWALLLTTVLVEMHSWAGLGDNKRCQHGHTVISDNVCTLKNTDWKQTTTAACQASIQTATDAHAHIMIGLWSSQHVPCFYFFLELNERKPFFFLSFLELSRSSVFSAGTYSPACNNGYSKSSHMMVFDEIKPKQTAKEWRGSKTANITFARCHLEHCTYPYWQNRGKWNLTQMPYFHICSGNRNCKQC